VFKGGGRRSLRLGRNGAGPRRFLLAGPGSPTIPDQGASREKTPGERSLRTEVVDPFLAIRPVTARAGNISGRELNHENPGQ